MNALRVALVHQAFPAEPDVGVLAHALAAAGHRPSVVAAVAGRPGRAAEDGVEVRRVPRLPDAPLRLRKIGDDLAAVPAAALAVRAGRFDVAHAFSPVDALAADWGARASVLTFLHPVRRERLSDRRLRLAVLERAVERAGALVAPSHEVADSVWHWLGVKARILAAGDAEGHTALYRRLL